MLGAAFALLLAGKKSGSGTGNVPPGTDLSGAFEKLTTDDGQEFAATTPQGKQAFFWALSGLAVRPDKATTEQPLGDSTLTGDPLADLGIFMGADAPSPVLSIPLEQNTGSGLAANAYIASLLTSADVSVWVDLQLTTLIVTKGWDQPIYGYPMLLLTTGADGWPPAMNLTEAA